MQRIKELVNNSSIFIVAVFKYHIFFYVYIGATYDGIQIQ